MSGISQKELKSGVIDRVVTIILLLLSLLLLLNEDLLSSSSFNKERPTGSNQTVTVQLEARGPDRIVPQLLPRKTTRNQQASDVFPSERSPLPGPTEGPAAASKETPLCPKWNRTMWALPENFDPASFCASYGEPPLPPNKRPRIFYGIMFGYEFDMLEVVLHESFPIVDKYILAESALTHSLKPKRSYFADVMAEPRFQPYLHKIANYTFHPRGRIRSGWEIERRQRRFGLKGAFNSSIRNGDIMIGNMDLDEVFQASYLMRLKYCKVKTMHFVQFQFRYHLNCLMIDKWSENRDVNFHWGSESVRVKDLYKARQSRRAVEMEPGNYSNLHQHFEGRVNWHLGTFGTLEEVMRKLQNSPHRFLANNSQQSVIDDSRNCRYGGDQRWMVSQKLSQLPKYIRQNHCLFRHKGWLPGNVTDD
jgi:hypothetical protein